MNMSNKNRQNQYMDDYFVLCLIIVVILFIYAIGFHIRHRASGTHGVWIGSGKKFRIKNPSDS